ncbi:MAG: hypothetical protein AAFS10_20155, partial [Myxococcota bacterium]
RAGVTRTPIGSGFNVELRATEAEDLETLLALAKVKPAIRAEIARQKKIEEELKKQKEEMERIQKEGEEAAKAG